jgi:DNA-directed RNA polymerase specialized sigma24 family protein
VDQPPANLNLVELYDELVAFALSEFGTYGLYGRDVVFFGTEKTAEDYAFEVFSGFLEGKIRPKGNRVGYLCTAIRNDIRDSARSKISKSARRQKNASDGHEEAAPQDLESIVSDELSPDEGAILAETEARIRTLAASDPKLKEFVECVLDLELTRPAEIAAFFGVHVDDIYARKKTLRAVAIRSRVLKVTAHG